MRLARKNSLDFYVGIFWIVIGAFTVQASWFMISLALEDKELWYLVLDTLGMNSSMNIMIAFTLFVAGFFQAIFGLFMAFTRDNSIDAHVSKKKIDPSE